MREGAWINAKTGDYVWVDDHARWLRRNPDQAARLGLPADVLVELGQIGWDLTPLAERVIALHKAMEAGFIRARGHGAYVTFEFTIPWDQAVRGAWRFMSENCGPTMTCRFNSLNTNQTIEFLYGTIPNVLRRPTSASSCRLCSVPGPGPRYLVRSWCLAPSARDGSVGLYPRT